LCLDLAVLLDVDVLVGLENPDLVVRKLDSEPLDQLELVLDLASVGLSLVLGLGELIGGGVLLQGDIEKRHLGGGA